MNDWAIPVALLKNLGPVNQICLDEPLFAA